MIFSMFSYTTFAISNNLNDLGSKYLVKSESEETDIRTESLTEVSFTSSNKMFFRSAKNKIDTYIYNNEEIKKAVRNVFFIGWDLGNYDWLTLETIWQGSDSIAQGHYPEICLAWLKSEDPKYSTQPTPIDLMNNGKTRKVRINCPVDVEIYENNELIGKIINDKKVLVTSYDAFGLNGDGEKQAYIPPSESYTIKITATDKGTVSYGIVEEHPFRSDSRILNFDNIPVEKGAVLKAYLPKFSKEDLTNDGGLTSSTHYTLFNETKNKEILPTSEYLMDDAKNYRTMIDVETEDIRKGNAVGSGERITNAPAKVYAIPAKGYRLEGWYENGVKVSEKYEYKTKADKYRKLTAKFITFEEYKKKVEQEKKEVKKASPEDFFNRGNMRMVRVNCPVDVEIYEGNELIGKIINDKKVLVTSYDVFGLNEDGEKQAYIPTDGSYTIKITATDKGTVSYGIVEEHPYKGTAKILNFDNIPIEKGTVLKAYFPKFSKEDLTNDDGLPSSTHYTLFNETKNKEILPTSEYLMDDAKNYRTMIDVETEDIRKGNAVGEGERITNAPVKVFAIPAKGYRLEGWYENGVKVSEEYEYKTKADKYRKLTARFITFEEYKKKVEQEKKDKNSSSTGGGNSQNKDSDKSKDTKPQKNTDDKSDTNAKKSRYTDIDNHWAKKYIKYLEDKDILSAFNDDVFNPNKYITRAELLTMLVKMKNLKTINYKGSFKDVSKDYPYADIIQTAYENKIIKGYGDGTFRPDNEISRAEMSVMLISLARGEDVSGDEIDTLLSIFKDKSKIPQWSKKYMAWSVKNKLIEGYDGNVNAKKNISRAEICTILYKIMTGNMIK